MKNWKMGLGFLALISLVPASMCVTDSLATVSDLDTQTVTAVGNAVTTDYTIGFTFQDNDHLAVYLQNEAVTPFTRTALSYGAGAGKYTVSGGDPGTTVVMGTAPAATERVVINRASPKTQVVDYLENAPFPASDHEDAMDKAVLLIQELGRDLDYKVGLSTATTATVPTFPDPIADRFIVYNNAGDDLTYAPPSTDAPSTGEVLQYDGDSWENFDLTAALALKETVSNVAAHTNNVSNPHSTTANHIGGTAIVTEVNNNATNTFDWDRVNKTGSSVADLADASHTSLDDIGTYTHSEIDTHVDTASGNPHSVTATEVGKDTAQWNADEVQGITVDDSLIGDGKGLLYDSGSGTLVYSNVPSNGLPGALGTAYQYPRIDSGATALVYVDKLGTANQVVVTNNVGNTTLSLPQDIDTAADVQFGTLTLGSSTFTAQSDLQIGVTGLTDINGSSTITVNGDYNIALNPTGEVQISDAFRLSLNSGQEYVFDNNDTDTDDLAIQGQTSGQPAIVSIFSADGDTTDDNRLEVFGRGVPGDAVHSELSLGYKSSRGSYTINPKVAGTPNVSLLLGASNNSELLLLNTSGRIGISDLTPGGKLQISGDDDEVQLIIEGNGTQTENLQEWKTSMSTVMASVDVGGNINADTFELQDKTNDPSGLSTVTLGQSTVPTEAYTVLFPPDGPDAVGEAMFWDGSEFMWATAALSGATTFAGITIDNAAVAGGALTLVEDDDNGSSTVILKAPDAVNESYTVTFPSDAPGTSTVLAFDGTDYLWAEQTPISAHAVHTYTAYGSDSNNKIPRFTTVATDIGTDITYVDSATAGMSWTINAYGIYSAGISFQSPSGALAYAGISLNAPDLTSEIFNLTGGVTRLCVDGEEGANTALSACSWTGILLPGDIVRLHTDGSVPDDGQFTDGWIVKVGNL